MRRKTYKIDQSLHDPTFSVKTCTNFSLRLDPSSKRTMDELVQQSVLGESEPNEKFAKEICMKVTDEKLILMDAEQNAITVLHMYQIAKCQLSTKFDGLFYFIAAENLEKTRCYPFFCCKNETAAEICSTVAKRFEIAKRKMAKKMFCPY